MLATKVMIWVIMRDSEVRGGISFQLKFPHFQVIVTKLEKVLFIQDFYLGKMTS